MVKRRKFVIGLGALVAGSGAALGTGASVNSTMDRDSDINVVNDDEGLLALSPGTEADSDVVRLTSNPGELTIDFSGRNDGGVNVNSKYQVGSLTGGNNDIAVFDKVGGGPTTHNAFTVVNNDTVHRDVTLEYSAANPGDLNQNGSYLYFEARPLDTLSPSGRAPIKDMRVDSNNPTASFSYSADNLNDDSIDSGNGIGVSILVDTTGSNADSEEDLTGTLTISGGTAP